MSTKAVHTQPRSPWGFFHLCNLWKWEIGACLLVLLSPIIAVATLHAHAGHPLPQWPFGLSVNVLLAAYSTVVKANITFITASCIGQLGWCWFVRGRPLYDFVQYDRASRGAWGSLRLLWTQRFRQPLTTLAGTVLVLSMFFDTSFQLLISQNDCSSLLKGTQATLARTNSYDGITRPQIKDEIWAAAESGIYGYGHSSEAVCATGNCTFSAPYGTIGYCSSCRDSSADITVETSRDPWNTHNESTSWITECRSKQIIKTTVPSQFMTGVDHLSVIHNTSWYCGSSRDDLELAIMSANTDRVTQRIVVTILAGKTSYSDKHRDITTNLPLEDCENLDSANSWRCRGYGAATCTLQPCVQILNATVEMGRTTEHIIASTGLMDWSPYAGQSVNFRADIGIVDTDCLAKNQKEQLITRGYQIGNGVRWLAYNTMQEKGHDVNETDHLTRELLSQKCLYLISARSPLGWFHGGRFFGVTKGYGYGTTAGPNDVSNTTLDIFTGSQFLQYIYDSGHIDFDRIESTFANISKSLTTYIRTHGNETYSEPATGEVFHYSTCLQVNWPWIAFPSVLVFLNLALFAMTVYSSFVQGTPVWTTFLLPWVIFASGTPPERDFDQMLELSKEIKVRVHPKDNSNIHVSP
ncbi:hypothetical protein NUW58_g2557 [Xylaria curta]|uniref:Uncharacterized protein n=1 Tax=Xylaria curta TaxID=42375 RepID=A0ACC1PEX8_9PEZI|nr:hypothetical protein NUW58_g2557 [Xylaria curta]